MTASFRPGMAQMPQRSPPRLAQAQPMPTVQYSQPYSQPTSTYSAPRSGGGGGGGSAPQYNTGSASSGTLKNWAQLQSYLDIYQVNAFYLGTAQRSQYIMSFWKLATCFGLQFIGILLLMEDQWVAYKATNTGACSGIKGNVALVGYFFATYITIFCTDQIRTLNRYGMYGWGEQQPEFVNSLWVGVGLWVNLFSLILSWFVSCIIIFTSEDILNMVLNSVAVTFMLTLDDQIVGASDYTRILQWDGSNNTACRSINNLYSKLGGLLLKIHPCWQRRIQIKNQVFECCDMLLCPFMIVIPFIVLFCYPYDDSICLYEEPSLCLTNSTP